jgi:DNA-binding beta-propeller fold protein YncE
MKKVLSVFLSSLWVLSLILGFLPTGTAAASADSAARGKFVIANRGSGSISVIDAHTLQVTGTYDLPPGPNFPEPMYVVFTPAMGRVFVGDRANNRVVVFDARSFEVEATVPTGAGVFHMWADSQNLQLWVNNDIDNTTTVINPKTLEIITTIPSPADLIAQGGKPHDVILDPIRNLAFVTIIGLPGEHDYVIQYSTRTFQEIGRAAVGKDAHVSLSRQGIKLFVPSQGSNVVIVLNRITMSNIDEIDVPGAHGAGMPRDGKVFYTTNLPGGGAGGLVAIDTRTNQVIGAVDTPYPVPHNIALTPDGKTIALTHSGGTADKVTFYQQSGNHALPILVGEATVGLNPFGLAYVP